MSWWHWSRFDPKLTLSNSPPSLVQRWANADSELRSLKASIAGIISVTNSERDARGRFVKRQHTPAGRGEQTAPWWLAL